MKKVLGTLCVATVLFLFAGCEPGVKTLVVSKLPDKLVYIASQDTELDLTGGELTEYSNAVPFFSSSAKEGIPMDSDWYIRYISHEVDFTTPGVYVIAIDLSRDNVEDTFTIQVVTQEEYDAMMTHDNHEHHDCADHD
jgi:hypothetical protein